VSTPDNALLVRQEEMSVVAVKDQVKKIQQLMKDVMDEGQHYGKIPGTDKPTLFKAGAEKLDFMFRLMPKFTMIRHDLPNNHREYEFVCSLYHQSGTFAGDGVGSCSTMETKYRYRNMADFEDTGEEIPKDSKERKQEYRKQGYGMKKIDGVWAWVKYKDAERQENPDIADTYNTVLKMAKKRALVDATITACAASDIFTQDIEDDEPKEDKAPPKSQPVPQAAAQPPAQETQAAPTTGLGARIASLRKALSPEGQKAFSDDLGQCKNANEQAVIVERWEKQRTAAAPAPKQSGKIIGLFNELPEREPGET